MDKNNTQNRDIPAYKIEELSQRYDKLETSWKKQGLIWYILVHGRIFLMVLF